LREYIKEKLQKDKYKEMLKAQAEDYRVSLQQGLPSLAEQLRDVMVTLYSVPDMDNQYNRLIQSLKRQFHMYNCLKYSTFGAATVYGAVQLFSRLRA
jgi:hypothetical protein